MWLSTVNSYWLNNLFMDQRKWKDTKCFLPPDHDPVFNADVITRKPTTCNYYPQMDLERSKPLHGPRMQSGVAQDAAHGSQSGVLLLVTLSLNRIFFWGHAGKKKRRRKERNKNYLEYQAVFRGKVQGLPLQASKLNAVVYALFLFYNCRKTIRNGKKQMP